MRFSILFAVGLATDAVFASVCKPRSSASSGVVSSESATSIISATAPTTTVEAESTTATSADLSTTLTSIIDDETTTEATETATTTEISVTVGSSTTVLGTTGTTETTTTGTATTETVTTDTTTTDASTTDEATTTAVTTSAETTTADATTTADTFAPIPTFNVLAIGAQVDGQKVSGEVETGYEIGWNLQGAPQILAFSIGPDTNQVIEISGYYLCVRYTDKDIHPLTLCDPGTENNFIGGLSYVTCEQTRDRTLECSAPAGQCINDPLTGIPICSAVPGTFTAFYTYPGMTTGVGLAMGRKGNSPTTDTQPVDLGIQPASDDS